MSDSDVESTIEEIEKARDETFDQSEREELRALLELLRDDIGRDEFRDATERLKYGLPVHSYRTYVENTYGIGEGSE